MEDTYQAFEQLLQEDATDLTDIEIDFTTMPTPTGTFFQQMGFGGEEGQNPDPNQEEMQEDPNNEVEASDDQYEQDDDDVDEQTEIDMATGGAVPNNTVTGGVPKLASVQFIHGQTFRVRSAPRKNLQTKIIVYPKEKRASLAPSKKVELYKSATQTQQKKYDFLSLDLSSSEKLDDTYNLGMAVKKTEEIFTKYDMLDVFTIVIPQDIETSPNVIGTKNLFKDYSNMTAKEVELSNRWYHEWAYDPWCQENLNWTQEYFQNNCEETLYNKVFESYSLSKYTGGPLFFFYMMQRLTVNTEEAALALKTQLEKLRLNEIEGENVDRAVSLVRGALARLESINRVPENIVNIVIDIFKSSSIDEFNEYFKQMKISMKTTFVLNGTTRSTATERMEIVEQTLSMATAVYRDMSQTDVWTGVKAKKKETVFVAKKGSTEPVCWNCGGNHKLPDCKKPRNEELIKKSKEEHNRRKKQSAEDKKKSKEKGSSDSKWKPPTEEEKNRRVIDGKPMFYQSRRKRWVNDRNPPQANTASTGNSGNGTSNSNANANSNVNQVENSGTTPQATVTSGDSGRNERINLAITNATQQITNSFEHLRQAFEE